MYNHQGTREEHCRSLQKHARFVVEDGRPQRQCHSKKKYARFVVMEDGRPQGALPHIHPAPVPTIYG